MGVSVAPIGMDRLVRREEIAGAKGALGSVAGVRDKTFAIARPPEVAVSSSGHAIAVNWASVEGATEVEVTSASVRAAAPDTTRLESVTTTPVGEGFQLSLGAHRRLLSIGLVGCKRGDGTLAAIANAGDLDPDRRLVIYANDASGKMGARYAIPHVGAKGGIPSQFSGASLAGGVVSFPELATTRVRVGLVDRTDTDEWAVQAMQLAGSVNVTVVVVSADLSLTTSDGATLWEFPGELTDDAGLIDADVAAPLQGALTKRLNAKSPLSVPLTLKSANDATVGFRLSGPSGALVRRVPGVVSVQLAGEALPLVLPDGALAAERPSTVTADVVVRYAGVRLLDEANDPLPAGRAVGGTIVGASPVQRTLPPTALAAHRIARIGIIGRSPEGCELSVQLVDAVASQAPLTPPGVCTVTASDDIGTWWVDLQQDAPSDVAPAISVRATAGRFFWVTGSQPLARVAVHDPDPGTRPVRLGAGELVRLASDTYHAKSISLRTDAFTSTTSAFDSTLFVTIELGDLTLRYAR